MSSINHELNALANTPLSGDARRFYTAAWRWHFYAGLYVAPFLIILSVTGLVMMYIALIEGRDGEKITVPVPQGAQALKISAQTAKALEAVSGGKIVEWVKPTTSDGASVFRVSAEGTNYMIAIDPFEGTEVNTWLRRDGWYDFATDIHATLLIGTTGDRLLEIAAGFGVVLILTGLYLWWPRQENVATVFFPTLSSGGRSLWKNLHRSVGFYVSILLFLFLLSGLSWTGFWGEKFVQAWNTFPAEKWENVPLSDDIHASMNHGAVKDVPWSLEQTPLPASGSDAGRLGIDTGMPVDIDSVSDFAQKLGYTGRFRVSFPKGEAGVWTVNQDSMSNDAPNPTADRTVHIDQYTGKVLADVQFKDYTLMAKAMAVGIAFHEGDMGGWNVIVNTLTCLAVIFLSISGIIMWWVRRPKQGGLRLFAPKAPEGMPHWPAAMLIMLVVSLAFPLVALSLIAVLTVDLLLISRIARLRKALS
ncbi:PepSY-associated TM helix domain-containing protein [Flexibacterium corallicola]|uniref:PepSY-associated TM helix domain-containing protein n=1 Tax=Flexibacterium corallicola TaxID=3037259 RepID=UPI00286FA6D5|nr:PepSY domain-containing protein [Pseudovibrio sp. M1P-2-3]